MDNTRPFNSNLPPDSMGARDGAGAPLFDLPEPRVTVMDQITWQIRERCLAMSVTTYGGATVPGENGTAPQRMISIDEHIQNAEKMAQFVLGGVVYHGDR